MPSRNTPPHKVFTQGVLFLTGIPVTTKKCSLSPGISLYRGSTVIVKSGGTSHNDTKNGSKGNPELACRTCVIFFGVFQARVTYDERGVTRACLCSAEKRKKSRLFCRLETHISRMRNHIKRIPIIQVFGFPGSPPHSLVVIHYSYKL